MLPIGDEREAGAGHGRSSPGPWSRSTSLAFFLEVARPPDALQAFVTAWGVVPREYSAGRDLAPLIPLPFWSTLLTSMFLHGGWMHLGREHALPLDLRRQPRAPHGPRAVPGLLPAVRAGRRDRPHRLQRRLQRAHGRRLGRHQRRAGRLPAALPAQPGARAHVRRDRPRPRDRACSGIWIVIQFVNSAGSMATTAETGGGGVAYLAHVGGFVAGLVLVKLFARRRRAGRRPLSRRPVLVRGVELVAGEQVEVHVASAAGAGGGGAAAGRGRAATPCPRRFPRPR